MEAIGCKPSKSWTGHFLVGKTRPRNDSGRSSVEYPPSRFGEKLVLYKLVRAVVS